MTLFSQIDSNRVTRVIVADDISWPETRLGGVWVETKIDDPQEQYAGPGMGYDHDSRAKFAPDWVQPTSAEDAYPVDAFVFHEGLIWQNIQDANVWEPGTAGWRDRTDQVPRWFQPSGAGDAFALDARVTHNRKLWQSNTPANVWEPGVFGWDEVIINEIPPGQSGWIDSGETVTAISGANLLAVTNTAPFPRDSRIRVNDVEATVSSIFTAGAPGLLVTSVNLRDTPGSIIYLWVERLGDSMRTPR